MPSSFPATAGARRWCTASSSVGSSRLKRWNTCAPTAPGASRWIRWNTGSSPTARVSTADCAGLFSRGQERPFRGLVPMLMSFAVDGPGAEGRLAGDACMSAQERGERNMVTLLDLMRKLASDAALAAEYSKDPAAVL